MNMVLIYLVSGFELLQTCKVNYTVYNHESHLQIRLFKQQPKFLIYFSLV